MYQHIFFDLDHTLWDFDRNSEETLTTVFESFQLDTWDEKINLNNFIEQFHQVNRHLWALYTENKIDQDTLRTSRFQLILNNLGLDESKIRISQQLSEAYLSQMPDKSHLLPEAQETLAYLSKKYQLHIITNGFPEIQARKLKGGGIYHYFDLVITSDLAGAKKPARQIFDFTISQLAASRHTCLMIGDEITTDIQGAINAEIDYIFFNPQEKAFDFEIKAEIKSLGELRQLL
jgi:putative hydrolase of the HAD superfamily